MSKFLDDAIEAMVPSKEPFSWERFNQEWDDLLEEEEKWEYTNAKCFVCGRSPSDLDQLPDKHKEYREIRPTNDEQRYVCSDHQDQDTSRKDFNVTEFIRGMKYHAKIFNHPIPTDQQCYKHIAAWHSGPRYRLVNMPEEFKKYLKLHGYRHVLEDETATAQLTLW